MSWHFLERWIEKANHHSTLVGKFWITFLIVCRIVIVASVGDRVYSDEQSEFKCNTAQPGCMNVCFNKFSPISHLRFWSFQILLVATPSVMFVIYSGHDDKGSKSTAKGNQKKKKKHASKHKNAPKFANKTANMNNNNNNNNNNNSNEENEATRRRILKRDHTGHGKVNRESPKNEQRGVHNQSPPLSSTVLTFQDEYSGNPVGAVLMRDSYARQECTVPWQEMRWNSLSLVEEGKSKNNKNLADPSTLWRKPKDDTKANGQYERNNKKGNLGTEVFLMDMPDDGNDGNEKYRTHNGISFADQDIYHSPNKDPHNFGGYENHQAAFLNSHIPPKYPGDEWTENGYGYPTATAIKQKTPYRFPYLTLEKTRTAKPRFTRHFHLYFLSVFVRLLIEVAFLLMQMWLFGFSVPALYQCNEWPCPNTVDCFVSRPMEKTIFLYFMLGFTCMCVVVNTLEFAYLFWVYFLGRPKLRMNKAKDAGSDDEAKANDNARESKNHKKELNHDSDSCDEEYDGFTGNDAREDVRGKHGIGRGRRRRHRRSSRGGKYLRDKQLQENMTEKERREIDLMINDEDQGDYDMDLNQNDGMNDIMQIDFVSNGGSGGGGGDDYNL